MRALSLWQPWASAVAVGAKRIETRSWSTSYRGPVAIHAAKRCRPWELIGFSSSWTWCGALRPLGLTMGTGRLKELLPFGAVVAMANIVDCRPTGSFPGDVLDTPRWPTDEAPGLYDWTERMMGDFSLGRWGWVLEDVQALAEPLPLRGKQGLWTLTPEVACVIRDSVVALGEALR